MPTRIAITHIRIDLAEIIRATEEYDANWMTKEEALEEIEANREHIETHLERLSVALGILTLEEVELLKGSVNELYDAGATLSLVHGKTRAERAPAMEEFDEKIEEIVEKLNVMLKDIDEVSDASMDSILSTVISTRTLSFMVLPIVIFTAIGTSFVVSRSISNPIKKLRKVAIEIGNGDLTKRAEVKSIDEIGELASSFNHMTEEIQKRDEGLKIEITERKQAQEKEKQSQQELNRVSRLATVGEMASGIAHEINNPLTGVIGFSDLLMSKDIPEDIRRDVNLIHEGAQRVASITDRMLSFARQYKPERTSANINKIIETTLAMRTYEMESSSIKLTTRLDPDLPATIADVGQLQQVFLNIILNAEQEMIIAHGRGNLSVKTERINDTIRISFKDDGPGISRENLDKLFDPFFTTREVGQGTGLGLSVSYGIITLHGGKIYAESRLGEGATFFVELPIVIGTEQLKLTEPTVESERVSGARILVVDDEPIIQQLLSEMMSEEGHEVVVIDNGNDALEKLGSEDFDVILLDIKLPGKSGIEIYKHLQKAAKSLVRKVVFITGDVMSEDITAFLSRTKASYISKPFDVEHLKNNIDRVLSVRA